MLTIDTGEHSRDVDLMSGDMTLAPVDRFQHLTLTGDFSKEAPRIAEPCARHLAQGISCFSLAAAKSHSISLRWPKHSITTYRGDRGLI